MGMWISAVYCGLVDKNDKNPVIKRHKHDHFVFCKSSTMIVEGVSHELRNPHALLPLLER